MVYCRHSACTNIQSFRRSNDHIPHVVRGRNNGFVGMLIIDDKESIGTVDALGMHYMHS